MAGVGRETSSSSATAHADLETQDPKRSSAGVHLDAAAVLDRRAQQLEADTQLVSTAFWAALSEMEKDGDRLNYRGPASGVVNNLAGTAMAGAAAVGLDVSPPSGCQGQSITMRSKLFYQKPFRDWKFELRCTHAEDSNTKYLPFSGYHWVVKATSPNGNAFLLDANKNQFGAWGNRDQDFPYKE